MAQIKLFFIFCIAVVNGQQQYFTNPTTNTWYNGAVQQVSQNIQNIASSSNDGIQAIIYKLFENMTADSNTQSVISEYARLSDNPSTSLQQIIQGKIKLLNALPAKPKSILEDAYSKQRNNMQDFLEDVSSQLYKNRNAASIQAFKGINEALAAYMSLGSVNNDVTGNSVCNSIKQISLADPEISKITQEHFKITPTMNDYNNVCQQQLFGFLVSAQGGTGTPTELIQTVKNKLQQWAQSVQNTANNAMNAMSNMANNVRNSFSGNSQ